MWKPSANPSASVSQEALDAAIEDLVAEARREFAKERQDYVCQECKDACSVLDIQSGGCDAGSAKTAYRDFAKVWHPDKFGENDTRLRKKAEEKFKKGKAAYDHLQEHHFSPNKEPEIEEMELQEAVEFVYRDVTIFMLSSSSLFLRINTPCLADREADRATLGQTLAMQRDAVDHLQRIIRRIEREVSREREVSGAETSRKVSEFLVELNSLLAEVKQVKEDLVQAAVNCGLITLSAAARPHPVSVSAPSPVSRIETNVFSEHFAGAVVVVVLVVVLLVVGLRASERQRDEDAQSVEQRPSRRPSWTEAQQQQQQQAQQQERAQAQQQQAQTQQQGTTDDVAAQQAQLERVLEQPPQPQQSQAQEQAQRELEQEHADAAITKRAQERQEQGYAPSGADLELEQQAQARTQARAQQAQEHASSAGQTPQPITNAAVTWGSSQTSSGQGVSWYADVVQRKIQQNMYRGEVDPQTPRGTQADIRFIIRVDGTLTDVEIGKSSGIPTLDRACRRAAQRVDTVGRPPSSAINGNFTVSCEY